MRFISEEEIEEQRTHKGGWNRVALAQWGVPWPPPAGWKHTLLAHGIPYQPALNTTTKRQKSEPAERPILCRNCCTAMSKNGREYVCDRCGLTWTWNTEARL
jgi:hypothetical protein